jgi:5-methylcytosine-specific restriction endonuclease McrA
MPRARGGADTWLNLATACKRCNAKKGDYTPEEANMPLRRKPHKPSYSIFLKDHMNGQAGEWDSFLTGHQGHH